MMSQREQFLRNLAQTNDFPLMLQIERAEACYQFDTDGKQYIDLISGISVANLGHNHPAIVKAIKDQVDKHLHVMVYGEFIQSPQVDYAEFLASNLPSHLNCVYFTNSGAEATEGAMKLAKRTSGRSKIISCFNSYHGSTQGALSLAGNEELKNAFRPLLPDIEHIRYNSFEDIQQIDEETAAVVIEIVQAEAGTFPGQIAYLTEVRKRCDEVGAFLIFDEIQTAFGRIGGLFGSDTIGIYPDIMLLGKALGGGLPLGAFIASTELMADLKSKPILGHITTFGGHPLSCAAGLASAKALIEGDLIANVAKKEQIFRNELKSLNVTGKGLMLSVQLADFDQLQRVCKYCIKNGLITDWFLFNQNSLRICPPLIIEDELIIKACQIINKAIQLS